MIIFPRETQLAQQRTPGIRKLGSNFLLAPLRAVQTRREYLDCNIVPRLHGGYLENEIPQVGHRNRVRRPVGKMDIRSYWRLSNLQGTLQPREVALLDVAGALQIRIVLSQRRVLHGIIKQARSERWVFGTHFMQYPEEYVWPARILSGCAQCRNQTIPQLLNVARALAQALSERD
jgi:hypothetical protein